MIDDRMQANMLKFIADRLTEAHGLLEWFVELIDDNASEVPE